jgi:glutamate decarboxylase
VQEKEVEDLMTESFSKNFIDYEEYPQSADIQNRCVSMIGRRFNAPTDAGAAAVGTSTVGSSEAIMLAVLAMKKRWQNQRKAAGKDYSKPNIVMSSAVQVCWEKAARYFEVEEKYVFCTKDRYVIDPEETVKLVDENTIGICVILGTTYTGEYEDAKAVNDLLIKNNIDTVIHIDAASGGFVAPFVVPDLEWDFRLEKVVSINTSGHKYAPSLFASSYANVSGMVSSTPVLAGSYGDPLSTCPASSSSTSTTSAPTSPHSPSTSPRALPRSLASTTS